MARRYFASPLPPAGPTTLSPRRGHHLGRVIGTRPGSTVVLFDGAGHEVAATVREVRGRDVLVDVTGPVAQPLGQSPRMAVDIACALPKSPRTDWLFEHGTAAGVRSFRPLVTERTRRLPDRHEHWRRILIAACVQCDRAILPVIEATVTLEELCAMPQPAARFVASFSELELGPATGTTALLVVGPEGGLTAAELHRLLDAGFAPRSLGPLTLRTEAAVTAGATRLLQMPPVPGPPA